MNGSLRGKDKGSEFTQKSVKNLKSAFNHKLSKAITVYRGTGATDAATFANMTTVGSVFKDKGAFSTSISRKSWASSKTNRVMFTVRLPKGYKGASWVQSISPHKHEKEVLVKPVQNWRVVRALKPLKSGGGSIPRYLIAPI